MKNHKASLDVIQNIPYKPSPHGQRSGATGVNGMPGASQSITTRGKRATFRLCSRRAGRVRRSGFVHDAREACDVPCLAWRDRAAARQWLDASPASGETDEVCPAAAGAALALRGRKRRDG